MSKRRLLELVKEGLVTRLGRSRACPRSAACAAAATRRRRSATSASGSAWPSSTARSTWRCWSICVREDLNRRAPRVMAVLRPLRVVIENYPEGQVRRAGRGEQPRGRPMGTRKVPFSRVLYIEPRRLPRGPAQEVFPLVAGPGSAAAVRLLCDLHGSRQGPGHGRGGRAALHVRSGHPRRFLARRPQGEGHDPLGVRRPCDSGRGAALRLPVRQGRPLRSRRKGAIGGRISTPTPWKCSRAAGWSPVWPRLARATASSSSDWAISRWTTIPSPGPWFSTARSRWSTPGPRSRSAGAEKVVVGGHG